MNDIRHRLEQAASDTGAPLRTDVPRLLERARADRRRHRARTTAAALSTVAVLAVGGVLGTGFLPTDSGRSGESAANTPSDSISLSTGPATSRTTKVDPGLPPSPENLYQVLVTADGWRFAGMDNSGEWGGSQHWTNGAQSLEVQWYPAHQYDTYLADRRHGATERTVELLGQSGHEFTEKPGSNSQPGGDMVRRSPEGGISLSRGPTGPGGSAATGHRSSTILPAVGEFFLIVDVSTTDKAAFDEVIGALTRVEDAAWERVIDRATVTESEGEAFLAAAERDVPIPDDVEVTVDDLNLPQSPYHARAAFAGPVLCGWAERYVAGDERALDVLRASRDWAVLRAMRSEGDYAEVVAESIEGLASGTADKGDPYPLDLFDQALGC